MKIARNALLSLGLFLLLAVAFTSFFRDSYAITDGVKNNTLPSGTWTTNYSTGNSQNYISDALGSTYSNRSNNFITYKDYKINNTSTPVYSYMKNLVFPATTESITVQGTNPENITDKGMLYIISHGYNKANTSYNIFSTGTYGSVTDNNIKQYITQIALWLYMYENKASLSKYCINTGAGYGACDFRVNDSTTLVSASDVRTTITEAAKKSGYNYLNYIIKLVDDAKKYTGEASSAMASISVNSLPTVNEKDGYIITDIITPKASSNDTNYMYYEVEISDPNKYGAYLADVNGNKITNTSALTGSFRVVVPISDLSNMKLDTIQVTVGGHFIKNNGYGYTVTASSVHSNSANNLMNNYNDTKYQKYANLLLGDFATEVASTNFKLNNFTKISKTDITTGKELAGATLVVTKKNSNDEKWTWVSGDEPHYITLSDGDYTLCETIPPKNYKTPDGSTSCIDFTVDNSKVTAVKMENAPIPNTAASVSKIAYIVGILLILGGVGIIAINYKNKREA